jgi:hypothetical protein
MVLKKNVHIKHFQPKLYIVNDKLTKTNETKYRQRPPIFGPFHM